MTREEAIKVLDVRLSMRHIYALKTETTFYALPDKVNEALDMAIAALREQEIAKDTNVLSNCWIPATERLPEVERSYLTFTDKGHIHIDSFCIYPEHGTKFWVGGNGKVTHWMPLPEPPEVEEV